MCIHRHKSVTTPAHVPKPHPLAEGWCGPNSWLSDIVQPDFVFWFSDISHDQQMFDHSVTVDYYEIMKKDMLKH